MVQLLIAFNTALGLARFKLFKFLKSFGIVLAAALSKPFKTKPLRGAYGRKDKFAAAAVGHILADLPFSRPVFASQSDNHGQKYSPMRQIFLVKLVSLIGFPNSFSSPP